MSIFLARSFSFLILLLSLSPALLSSLSLPNSPHFDPKLLLVGDATWPSDGDFVQLTAANSSRSSGLLIQSFPFRFQIPSDSNYLHPVSFSTDFTFSISPHNGDGLALVIVPVDFMPKFSRDGFGLSRENRFVAVEFDTLLNGDVQDGNGNHVGVDVGNLVSKKVSNVSSVNLVLNSGVKLHSWVDYDSSSKRLEVRLGEFGHPRPYDPLLVCGIDLGEMWKGEEVLFGLSSTSGDSVQSTTRVYSWKFVKRIFPKWLHSNPVDPHRFSDKQAQEKTSNVERFSALKFLFGAICGMMFMLGVRFLRSYFANNNQVIMIPVKYSAKPEDIRYEKINVAVEDGITDMKN